MPSLLIAHGGAPTAVLNASLYGAVMEAKKHTLDHIYGARFGSAGILREEFIDLDALPSEKLSLLLQTPASAIGTSRTQLESADYMLMREILLKHHIHYVLFNGGNGSMDTCGKLKVACEGTDICVCGIPKTIDNDIALIDHAPGFGSAARYIAQCTAEAARDVMSLPIHVCVIEAMGRNAGWLAAATALARTADSVAPDLIYMPEVPFDQTDFLTQVERLYREKGGIVVVASEGLRDKSGTPIVPPIFQVGRATYYGDVSAYLAELVIKKLGIKARSEKPGLLGRCSIGAQSPVDRAEAIRMGECAAQAVLSGKSGYMSGLMRVSTNPYVCKEVLVPIEEVMLKERTMPREYIAENGHDVTPAFVNWCRPLLGGPLPEMINLT